jgi:acylpyruvate hydrolase
MKLVTLVDGPLGEAGVLLSEGDILVLSKAQAALSGSIHSAFSCVRALLENGLLSDVQKLLHKVESDGGVRSQLLAAGAIVPGDAPLMAPIPRPSFILAQGLAYRNHLEEMNVPLPKEPAALIKAPSSLTGSGQAIILPRDHPDMVDFEGEFCAVIGKPCYRVAAEDVYDYVAGYTIMNDVSARDWVKAALQQGQAQMEAVLSWNKNLQGKQFPTFTPLGPYLVTKDEIPDPHALQLTTRLNGEVMQHANISDLIFRIEDFIAYYSQWYRFEAGDIISTGTPGGVGQGRDPQVFMKAGDLVEVSVTSLGTLSNHVENEA